MTPELQNLPWGWPQIQKYVAEQVATATERVTERADKAEAIIDTMLRCVGKDAGNVDDPVAAIKATYRSLVDARERTVSLQAVIEQRRDWKKQSEYITELQNQISTLTRERDESSQLGIVWKSQIETLTRERDEAEKQLLIAHNNALTSWREELEAKRAGAVAMREALQRCKQREWISIADIDTILSSTAGAETLAELRDLRQFKAAHETPKGSAGVQCCDPVIDGEIGALRERLRKAEADNKKLRDDIAARPLNPSALFAGFLQDQVVILKERIATLEAALAENEEQRGENWRVKAGHLEERVAGLAAALVEARADMQVIANTACDQSALLKSQLHDAAHVRIGRLLKEGKPCAHERLNEYGICRACGAGIGHRICGTRVSEVYPK